MNKPLVTIITATYDLIKNNRKDYFLQMVNSIRNQTYTGIEHLIIDGGSDDGSVELFKELGLNYISEPDDGIYYAFNKGIQLAKGKYINFMNSDDYFCNNKAVELSVEILEKDKSDFSCAAANILDENDKLLSVMRPRLYKVYAEIPFCHQTMFVKTELLKKYNGFDLKYKSASDYDFIIKIMLDKAKYSEVKDTLVCFRKVGMSAVNVQESIDEQMAIFKNTYSQYTDFTLDDAKRIIDKRYVSVKLLMGLGITEIGMYRGIFRTWRRQKEKQIINFLLHKK